MKHIAFLAASADAANDNRERLPAAFEAAGWRTTLLFHESLGLTADGVAACDATDRLVPLASFDLVWLLGFGGREGFLDRMQMLKTLDQARFVNAVDALVYLHGKFDLRGSARKPTRAPMWTRSWLSSLGADAGLPSQRPGVSGATCSCSTGRMPTVARCSNT